MDIFRLFPPFHTSFNGLKDVRQANSCNPAKMIGTALFGQA